MKIANNVLKEYLKNVYFITGTACAGKTTVTKVLADKYNLIPYHVDDKYNHFYEISDEENQPIMNTEYTNWNEYFNRKPNDYSASLNKSLREGMDFAILELIRLSNNKKVIVDCQFPINLMKEISNPSQCVVLIADYNVLRSEYFNRRDKEDIYNCILALDNSELILENVLDAITYDYYEYLEEVGNSGFSKFFRTKFTEQDAYVDKIAYALNLNQL